MQLSHVLSFNALSHDPYMSPRQLDYFKQKLLSWRSELEETNRQNLSMLSNLDVPPIEEMERSSQTMNIEISIITQARNWHLIHLIDVALERIEAGTYGYCEATDDPIGFARLDANPVALYCLGVQEELEKRPCLYTADAS